VASANLHSTEAHEIMRADSPNFEQRSGDSRLGNSSSSVIDSEVPVVAVTVEEISGRLRRKRFSRREADALNGCLCGQVLDNLTAGVLKCNQPDCETQWVSHGLFTTL
jgi:hypothetical protein